MTIGRLHIEWDWRWPWLQRYRVGYFSWAIGPFVVNWLPYKS